MATHPGYPFVPKSTTHLRPGDFWGVPLSDGRFACGRVMAVEWPQEDDNFLGTRNSRIFFAGLMDWSGEQTPTSDDLVGSQLLAQGSGHIKLITESGGAVLGHRPLDADAVTGLMEATHKMGGTVWLFEGVRRLRPATREESASGPWLSGWGFRFITSLAESHFVDRP